MFQHNIVFEENMDNEQLDYIEKCCLGVCFISTLMLACLMIATQDLVLYWKSLFRVVVFTDNNFEEILICIGLIMLTILGVIIILNTVETYASKIDRLICTLNNTIKEKNDSIKELEYKLETMQRKFVNFTL